MWTAVILLCLSELFGVLIGIFATGKNENTYKLLIGFSVGIMLYSVISSIIPKDDVGIIDTVVSSCGILLGTAVISFMQKVPRFVKKLIAKDDVSDTVLLFVVVSVVHKLPEGIAAGIAVSGGEYGAFLALGIGLQNIPDGIVVTSPLVSAGVSKPKAFSAGIISVGVSAVGIAVGILIQNCSTLFIDFPLSFACGMIIYVTFELLSDITVSKSVIISISVAVSLMAFINILL